MSDEQPKHDPVNHPAHYNSDPSGVECITIIRHRNFNVGSAIKYLWRAGLKDNAPVTQDLRKAIWCIEDEINRLKDVNQNGVREAAATSSNFKTNGASCDLCGQLTSGTDTIFHCGKIRSWTLCSACYAAIKERTVGTFDPT